MLQKTNAKSIAKSWLHLVETWYHGVNAIAGSVPNRVKYVCDVALPAIAKTSNKTNQDKTALGFHSLW